MDEATLFLLLQWLRHIGISGIVCLPIVIFGWKRAHWHWWEIFAFVFPFWIWGIFMLWGGKDKSMANLGEAWIIALLIPTAALVRLIIGYKENQSFYPKMLLLLLCLASIAVYYLVPVLPER